MNAIQFKTSTDGTNKPVPQAVVQDTVFRMTNKDRLELGHGPTFAVRMGEKIIAEDVPKRSAMALSTFFNETLAKHPRSSTIMFNPAQMDERPLRILLDFIKSNSKTTKPFGLRVSETLAELVSLYRHSVLFGMAIHAGGLRAKILEHLAGNFSVSFVALTELTKLPATDRCYQVAVRKLEGLVHIGAIDKNDEQWKTWAQEHADFTAAMEKFKVEREAAAVEKHKRHTEALQVQRAQDWEESFPPLV